MGKLQYYLLLLLFFLVAFDIAGDAAAAEAAFCFAGGNSGEEEAAEEWSSLSSSDISFLCRLLGGLVGEAEKLFWRRERRRLRTDRLFPLSRFGRAGSQRSIHVLFCCSLDGHCICLFSLRAFATSASSFLKSLQGSIRSIFVQKEVGVVLRSTHHPIQYAFVVICQERHCMKLVV